MGGFKWKGASFFGLGPRPVTMEGSCISGRACLFWAAQLNAVECPAVAVSQTIYCKKMGEGSFSGYWYRRRKGLEQKELEFSVSTCEEHLTPLLLMALVRTTARLAKFLPSEFTSWNAVGQQFPCDTATEPALKYCCVCHQHQTPQCPISSQLRMPFKQ